MCNYNLVKDKIQTNKQNPPPNPAQLSNILSYSNIERLEIKKKKEKEELW